jgi:hypothetical protein
MREHVSEFLFASRPANSDIVVSHPLCRGRDDGSKYRRRRIPGELELARKIAEAEIDVILVRRARSDRVSDELSECNYRNKTRQVFRSWLAILMNDQSESLSPEEPEGKEEKDLWKVIIKLFENETKLRPTDPAWQYGPL